MEKIWVVVADEAIARILQWPESGDELQPVEELTDPDAHASTSELRRDAYGRRAGAAGQGDRQNSAQRLRSAATVTASAGEDEQHQEADAFARRLAVHLSHARQQKRFDELHIVAAPRFLGLLRKHLDPNVEADVREEVNRDFVHLGNREITERLFAERMVRRAAP
jgi:protein required for attachment to host cells